MVLSLCAIILLFSLLALLVVPARFYKKNSLLMQKFCLRMIFVEKVRKLYTLGLLMALIIQLIMSEILKLKYFLL